MRHTRYSTKRPKIKITEIKEPDVLGWCYADGIIEIDPRQNDKNFFLTLCHELIHHHFPDISEKDVIKMEKIMGEELWNRSVKKVIAKHKKRE